MEPTYYEKIAARIVGIEPEQIFHATRKEEVVLARQMCMYYRNKVLKHSNRIAGERYSKDHATVNHAVKKINDYRETSKQFDSKFDAFIERSLHARSVRLKMHLEADVFPSTEDDIHYIIAKASHGILDFLKRYEKRDTHQLRYMLKSLDSTIKDIENIKKALTPKLNDDN